MKTKITRCVHDEIIIHRKNSSRLTYRELSINTAHLIPSSEQIIQEKL